MARLRIQGFVSTFALGIALVHAQRADAQALPSGATVARGIVTIGAPDGGALQIDQTSARAIVNWQSFNVGGGGTVTINQPDRNSALLNRVGGSQGTTIDGTIQSNGQVFLINPNGVAIGASGVVNAGGFVASTLDITNDDFMAGRLNFAGNAASGAASNAGRIDADSGFVALIGTSVSNSGTITANMGRVALGAATSATLDLSGDGFLQVLLPTDASDVSGRPLVDESGTIIVNGGRVRIKASVAANAVRQVINLSGTIQADSVSGVNGDVVLQTVGGGDIVGDYQLFQPGSQSSLHAVPASITADQGSVRLDAAGSINLVGTQIDAGSIAVIAGRTVQTDITPYFGPFYSQVGVQLNASRIDITGDSVVLDRIIAHAPDGLVRIGGAFRDNAIDDGSDSDGYYAFAGRYLQNGAKSLPYLPLAGTVTVRNFSDFNAYGANIIFASRYATSIDPYTNFSGLSLVYYYNAAETLNVLPPGGPDASQSPQFGVVSAGTVTSSVANGTMSIVQTSDRAVIDWRSFNIGTGYTVSFAQPSSTSAVLNRVGASAGVSTIAGTLSGNGRVFLVNPNGVVITSGGVVSTLGGFTASSLPIANGAFMAGTLSWDGNASAATVSNAGTITAQNAAVTLLGGGVSNTGTIATGTAGTVELVASGAGSIDVGQVSGGTLRLGARTVTIGTVPGADGLSLTPAATLGLLTGFGSVSIEAGNDLSIGGNLALGIPTLLNVSFAAGRNLTVTGQLQTGATTLSLTADSATAALGVAGARGTGAATLDVTGAALASSQAVNLALAGGSGIAGGLIRLAPMTVASNLSIGAPSDGIIRFGGSVSAGGTIALTGSLQFSADSIVSAPTLSWSAAAGETVGGFANGAGGFTASAALVSGTTALFRGILQDGTAGRIDFGGFTPGNVSLVYGDESGLAATTAVRLVNGGLQTGDTLTTLLAPGELIVTGAGPGRRDVGTYTVTVTAPSGASTSGDKAGYFFDLRLPTTNSFAVTPKPITFVVANAQSFYGTAATASASLTGVLAGDSVNGTVSASAGAGQLALTDRLSAGSYSLAVTGLTGTSAGNYSIVASNGTAGTLTVAQRTLTATAQNATSTYGTAALLGGAQLTGVLSGDQVLGTQALSIGGVTVAPSDRLGAGSYAITVSSLSGSSAGNYLLGGVTNALLTINPKLLQLSLGSAGYTYGSSAGIAALAGVLSGDALGLAGTLDGLSTTLSGAPGALALTGRTAAGAHQLAVTALTGTAAANYTLDPASATTVGFTITPKPITYSTDLTFGTYGDFASLVGSGQGIHLNGVLAGDDVVGIGAVDAGLGLAAVDTHTTAGSWNLLALLSGSSASNYVLDATGNSTGRLTLAKRHITASIGDVQSTYGTLANLAVTLNNVVAGDDVHGVGTLLTDVGYATDFDNRLAAGQYRITSDQTYSPTTGFSTPLSGSAAGNYIFDYGGNGILTIMPKQISAVLTGATYVYGSPTATIALSGTLFGDTLTPTASLDGNTTAITAHGGGYDLGVRVSAGTHAINVTAISGANVSNYVLAAGPDATVTITPRPLTWAVADMSSVYGNLASPVASLGNLLGGESVAATFLVNGATPTANARVGTYATSVGGLAGADAGNYMLAATGNQIGRLTITPRPVTYVLGQQTSTYGDLATLTIGFANTLLGDTLTGPGTITVAQGGAAVTLNDRSNAGSYQLGYTGGLAGADAANYTLTGGSAGTLTIGKRTISLTPDNISSVYGTLAVPTGTFAGVLSGDQLTPVIARYAADQTIPISANLDAYSYTIGSAGIAGPSAGNYQLDGVRTATLTVNPKPITITIGNQGATYGSVSGTTNWAVGLSGVLAGDRNDVGSNATVVLNGADAAALLDAGTYTISAGSLQGGKAIDYVVVPGGSMTATLTVDPFLIGATGNLSTIYGTPANIGGIGLTATIAGLTVDRVLLSQGQTIVYRATTSVGTYQMGLSNLLLNGQPTGNYLIDPSRTASLTIRPRTVFMGGTTSYVYGTVGATATLNPYDANQFVAGDDARIVMTLNSLSASGMANAGSYSGVPRLAGSSAFNYVFDASSFGNVQVERRSLTAVVNGTMSRTYGDVGDITSSLTGIITGDTVSLSTTITSDSTDINFARYIPGTYAMVGRLTGAAVGNYTLASDSVGTLTITKRPVWFDPAGLNQSYGSIGTPALVNAVPGDTVRATSTLLALDGTVADQIAAPVGRYRLSGSIGNNRFYVLEAPGGGQTFDFTIVPRVLDFAGSASLIFSYQTSNSALQGLFSGLLSQDIDRIAPIYTGVNGSSAIDQNGHPDAGTYALAIGSLGGVAGGNYVLGTNAASVTINPLTVSWRLGGSGTYGNALGNSDLAVYKQIVSGENQTFGNRTVLVGSLIGLPLAYAGDVQLGASIVGTGARVGQFTDAGTYQLTSPILTGASARNFQLAATPFSTATSLVIAPRTVSFSATGRTIAYAGLGATPSASVALNGILNGDDVRPILGFETSGGSTVTQFPAGTYYAAAVGLTGAKSGNYRAVDWRQTASDGSISAMVATTIAPRTLTIAPPSAFAYGDALDLTTLLSGVDATLAAADGIGIGVGLPSGGFSTVSALDAGAYTAQYRLSGSLSANYQLASSSGAPRAITISPRTIGYSIAPVTGIYGETPTYAATLTNTLAGRATPLYMLATTQTGASTIALAQAGQLDIGSYFARVTGLSGEKSSNYLFQPIALTTGATTIVPRSVTFNQAITSIYGDTPVVSTGFSQKSGVTGLVNGDVLTATAGLSSGDITALKVGSRAYDTLTFAGAKLGNYAITLSGLKALTVTPRTLTYQLYSGAVYGDGSPIATLGNVVNGDSVQPIVRSSQTTADGRGVGTEIGGAVSGVTTYANPYREVGTYQYALYGLVGTDAANYVLPFRVGSMNQVDFTITQRPITPKQILTSGVYGSTFLPVGWNNILPGDDTNGQLDPVVANLSAGVPTFTTGRVFGANATGALVKLDVGSYLFQVTGISGSRSANYSFTAPLTFTFAITPAPFEFGFDTQNRYYGGQTEVCDAKGSNCAMQANTSAFYARGGQRFASDDVNAVVTLTDASGTVYSYTPSTGTFTYNAGLAAGTYAITTASLFGAQAKNYYIPADYTKTLTIKPAVVGYQIDAGAGFYFKGLGYFGTLPSVKLNGVYGNDQVAVAYGIFGGKDTNSADPKTFYANASDLPVGTNHLQATGLVASANYVLRAAGGTWGAGALETVNDASFFNLPLANFTTADPNKPVAPTSSVMASVVGGSKSTVVGFGATAGVSGSAQTTDSLGNGVNLVSSASGGLEVTANIGPVSASAAVGAKFDVNETITYGPGYTTIGAEGAARSSISLTPLGLTTKNIASLDAYQVQGVAGGLGNGVDGTLAAKVTEGVRAEGSTSVGYADGQLTLKTKAAAGAGVSVGVNSGISGSLGSITAGATVYSPGMVAAGFEPSVGYSDGKLNVSFSLTAAIGIGGIDISFGGAIDVGVFEDAGKSIANAFVSLGNSIGSIFGGGCDSVCEYVGKIQGLDPVKDSATIVAALTPGTSPLDSRSLTGVLAPDNVYTLKVLANAKLAEAAKAKIAAEAKSEQALVTKLLSNPGAFTAADYAAVQSAQTSSATTLAQANAIIAPTGQKFAVSNGVLTSIKLNPFAISLPGSF